MVVVIVGAATIGTKQEDANASAVPVNTNIKKSISDSLEVKNETEISKEEEVIAETTTSTTQESAVEEEKETEVAIVPAKTEQVQAEQPVAPVKEEVAAPAVTAPKQQESAPVVVPESKPEAPAPKPAPSYQTDKLYVNGSELGTLSGNVINVGASVANSGSFAVSFDGYSLTNLSLGGITIVNQDGFNVETGQDMSQVMQGYFGIVLVSQLSDGNIQVAQLW